MSGAAPTLALPHEEIRSLVERFYGRVRQDTVLAPVFTAAVGDTDAAWAAHLDRLADFWSSVMQASGRYHGDPFSAHLRLKTLDPAMFDRWLALFHATCAEMFDPTVAAAFTGKAERIARSLRMGLFPQLPPRTDHSGPFPTSRPPSV